jgi:hypothetical protein
MAFQNIVFLWWVIFGGVLVQGFGPMVPLGPLSPLKALVSFRAIGSSIYSSILKDLVSDNSIFEAVFKSHFHPEMDAIYIGVVTASMMKTAEPETQSRLSDIKIYSDIHKKTRIILFVLSLILTKNIESVS